MKLDVRDIFKMTIAISLVLFFTGIAVVPWVTKMTADAASQNIMYAIGRVPVVFAVIYVYLNMGEK